MTTAQLITELEKRFTKEFGKKCPEEEAGCPVCDGWYAIDELKRLYDVEKPPKKPVKVYRPFYRPSIDHLIRWVQGKCTNCKDSLVYRHNNKDYCMHCNKER